jgi:hypothetical protein
VSILAPAATSPRTTAAARAACPVSTLSAVPLERSCGCAGDEAAARARSSPVALTADEVCAATAARFEGSFFTRSFYTMDCVFLFV